VVNHNTSLHNLIQQETELFFKRLETLDLRLKARGIEPHWECYKEYKKELLLEMLEEFSDQLRRIDFLVEIRDVNALLQQVEKASNN